MLRQSLRLVGACSARACVRWEQRFCILVRVEVALPGSSFCLFPCDRSSSDFSVPCVPGTWYRTPGAAAAEYQYTINCNIPGMILRKAFSRRFFFFRCKMILTCCPHWVPTVLRGLFFGACMVFHPILYEYFEDVSREFDEFVILALRCSRPPSQ